MRKKNKLLCLALCGALALGAGSLGVAGIRGANAASQLIIPQEYKIEEEYGCGEIINVPAPSTVKIKTLAGEGYASSVVLQFPDGTAKSEGSYTLDKAGVYTLTYYSNMGTSATQTFVVNKSYYGVGQDASAVYTENLVGVEGKQGIDVSLKDGGWFTFNQPINLYDYAGQELEVCKIFPLFKANPDLDPDASTVSVKLVDCYDSTRFVEFYLWSDGAGPNGYYGGAGASTQVFTGLEQNSNRPHEMTEAYEGQLYKIHRPQRYQSKTAWGAGLGSKDTPGLLKNDGFTLIWDLATHQMKVRTGNGIRLLTDIDSTEIYGVNAIDFDSFFTTGEVYLNVQVYNYATNVFHLGLESIFGGSGAALQNEVVEDNDAPDITVDVVPTYQNTVYLQKGKAMTLPAVKQVLDYNYYGKLRVDVYRNYGKPGQILVGTENGTFTPETAGNYTAVYAATDSYGNVGKYCLDMVVLDEPNIVYTQTPVNKLVAATVNLLPEIEAVGLNQAVRTQVQVITPRGETIPLEHNGVDGYEFLPEYAGQYTVKYLFQDNVYVEEYAYTVACVDEQAVTFKNPFAFPAYFMKGASYSVKPVVAYTAGDSAFKENAATVSVSVDGGQYTPLTAAQMAAYKVEAENTLQFKATYGENSVESKLYSIVDVGYGKKTTQKNYLAYMQGNYTSAEMQAADPDNGILSGALYGFAGDANLCFINPISSHNFKVSFTVEAEEVESVAVVLRNVRDPEQNYITYTYVYVNGGVVVNAKKYVDGKVAADVNGYTKYRSLTGTYSMDYSIEGMATGNITVEDVGMFDTDDAILEIHVNGAANGCKVLISEVMNQKFTSTMREAKPQIYFERLNGVQEGNSVYTIRPCYASAALCSVMTKDVVLTVTTPDGGIATSVDGVRLENVTADRIYQLKLTSMGQYRVSYFVSCIGSSRNNAQETLQNDDDYIINVSEGIAPTIEFKDGSNTQTTVQLKVGSTHKIKEFTVTDNHSSGNNIKVYTMILDKSFLLEENGYNVKSYVFKNAGEFVVYVLAYDEYGNSSANYYNVVVS